MFFVGDKFEEKPTPQKLQNKTMVMQSPKLRSTAKVSPYCLPTNSIAKLAIFNHSQSSGFSLNDQCGVISYNVDGDGDDHYTV